MSTIKAYLGQKLVKEIIGSLLLVAIIALPVLTFAKHGKNIYVDDSASGSEDGSSSHPYKTIGQALKKAHGGDEVHVSSGTYKENIILKEDVKLYGSGRDKVTIKAHDDDSTVVSMEDGSKLNGVKVTGGNNGIEVERDAKVSITKCTIEDNDRDGIRIRSHKKIDDDHAVTIDHVIVRDNGKAGIYSDPHRVVVTESDIRSNHKDGIILASGVSAWLGDNEVKSNGGSGFVAVLDYSNILTSGNSFGDNKREGIQISAYGAAGRIDIKNSKVHGNNRYGIARVERANVANSRWNNFTVQSNVTYWDNSFGNLSPIINVN
ncbi:DUF1565 domain-containing protein [Patescibacteria group bacterium]|nr:MAG: DUF1565 domain-containing protein [Patescibacteria group bacterium]